MEPRAEVDFELDSAQALTDFGSALSPVLRPGDIVALTGGLGAGKTHLARSIIQDRLLQAGMWEDVPSPTYTLVQTYTDGNVEIWHADCYRLLSTDGLEELGLLDAPASAILLVEWPDLLIQAGIVPSLTVAIEIPEDPSKRVLNARASSEHLSAFLNNRTRNEQS